jgi:hypothetical protein
MPRYLFCLFGIRRRCARIAGRQSDVAYVMAESGSEGGASDEFAARLQEWRRGAQMRCRSWPDEARRVELCMSARL